VNLSNFFFHPGLHPSAGRWSTIKTEMGDFQWTALPLIGRADWPKWWGRHCATRRFTLIWYVDDILILGDRKQSVSTILEILLMQPSRVDCQQNDISINSEPTGELPGLTDQSDDQDGGASACKVEQGDEDDEGLPAEEEIITGSYR